MSLLSKRLKIEKFIKEQLWQLLLVITIVVLFACLLDKIIEAIVFCTAHLILRRDFNKQYHSGFTAVCLSITIAVAFFGIIVCLPINVSLLSSIPLAFIICWVGDIAQDRLDCKSKIKELTIKKPFDIETCTRDELVERCLELRFSQRNIELAIEFFINKTPQRLIADKLCIDEKSVTTRKKRMKLKLNS